MKKTLFLLLVTVSSIYSKEIEVTSLMTGLYVDVTNHFNAYKSDVEKKEISYDKGVNGKLTYDAKYMFKTAGRASYRKVKITKIYPKNHIFEFNIDSTILKFMIEISNKNHSKNATVKLYDPNGKLVVNDKAHNVTVSDIESASVIKVTAPIYGKWKMVFNKHSDIEGSISAVSPMYMFGFSFKKTVFGREGFMDIDRKKPSAIIGSKSEVHLASRIFYKKDSLKVKFVETSTGKEQALKIRAITSNSIYLKRAKPKYKTFDIYIEGVDINGYKFTRKTKRPYLIF